MKTPYRKDCKSGLAQVHKDLFSVKKNERLSTNIKLTLYKALIRSVMTYAGSTWEYAADVHLLKLQRLQNRFVRATGKFERRNPVREMLSKFLTYTITWRTMQEIGTSYSKSLKSNCTCNWERKGHTQEA
jgi:hypothetical protein